MERKKPIYNLKYTNEASSYTNAGFSFFKPVDPFFSEKKGNVSLKKYLHEEIGAEVWVKETSFEDTVAIRQETEVLKTTDSVLPLTELSSAMICGIEFESFDDFYVHYTNNMWQTECQWKCFSLTQMGFHIGGNHGLSCVKQFRNVGTRSTETHYPLVFLEDRKKGEIYFMEIESSTNWMIEIGTRDINNNNVLYMECNCAYENFDGWYLMMEKGDRYKATPAVVGKVKGGFNEAVNELLKYKRQVSLVGFDNIPVIFNDYMNCIWGKQIKEKIIPLVDRASEAGAEIFCMDDGWEDCLGDWNINEDNFGDMKLKGVVDYINKKSMKAGIWLEVEAVSPKSKAYKEFYDGVYKLHGFPITGDFRVTMDFRYLPFKKHIENVVDKLYNIGIRYIKNDYNKTGGIGIDGEKCPSCELREATLAFYNFIDEMKEKYPDLIWENCGGGAQRNDGGILRHFSIASTSDLEYFYHYPSVMIGTNACIPLEKSGIWSYPYPRYMSCGSKTDSEIFTKEYIDERKDGSETVFNMVTSMFGCMYLSGRIDKCDEYNFSLIKEAVDIYKTYSKNIKNAFPVFFEYPINTANNYTTSFGLHFPNENKLLAGLWNYNGNRNYSIDLRNFADENTTVKILYPSSSEIKYTLSDGILTVVFDKDISAGIIEINL